MSPDSYREGEEEMKHVSCQKKIGRRLEKRLEGDWRKDWKEIEEKIGRRLKKKFVWRLKEDYYF